MRIAICLFAAILSASLAHSQTRDDNDAAASLALHAAAARHAAVSTARIEQRESKPMTFAEAMEWTRQTHRPVLVAAGLNCSNLCSGLRPEIPTVHADGPANVKLLIAAADGTIWQSTRQWATVPSESDVRSAAADLARYVEDRGRVQSPPPVSTNPILSYQLGGNCPSGVCPTGNGELSRNGLFGRWR